jgi:hypothetical protein
MPLSPRMRPPSYQGRPQPMPATSLPAVPGLATPPVPPGGMQQGAGMQGMGGTGMQGGRARLLQALLGRR